VFIVFASIVLSPGAVTSLAGLFKKNILLRSSCDLFGELVDANSFYLTLTLSFKGEGMETASTSP